MKYTKEQQESTLILGLSSSFELAKEVAKKSNIELGEVVTKRFADKEIFVELKTSVRYKNIILFQSTSTPANDNLMELLICLDALKRASAKSITIFIPYFGYARQDRKAKGRQPITAKLIADLLTIAGASRILSFDIHSDQIQGFFNIPFDNLRSQGFLAEFVGKELSSKKKDFVIVSPDHGGVSRARAFAERFNCPLAIIDKRRVGINKTESLNLLGEVKDKVAIIFDDIVDTGGTMEGAIKFLKQEKAKEIYLVFIHAVLSSENKKNNDVITKLQKAGVNKMFTTNTISDLPNSPLLRVADLSSLLADVVNLLVLNKSISNYFVKKWN